MMKASTIKKIRLFPLLLLGFLLSMILLQALISFTTDYSVIFKASPVKNFSKRTYDRVETKEFTYVTGMEGEVRWKPKSGLEAFYFNFFVNDNSLIRAVDFCYISILVAILFWMLHDLRPETVFSEKILEGFNNIFRLAYFLILKDIFQSIVSRYFINRLTHGTFTGSFQTHALPFLLFGVGTLVFQQITKFFLQAQKMEQEQNLTV